LPVEICDRPRCETYPDHIKDSVSIGIGRVSYFFWTGTNVVLHYREFF
jgi:hypothetical protein